MNSWFGPPAFTSRNRKHRYQLGRVSGFPWFRGGTLPEASREQHDLNVPVLRRCGVDNALLATVFSISQAIQPAPTATSPESVNSLLLNSMDARQIVEKARNQVPLRCEKSAAPVELKVERLGTDGIVLCTTSGELILKADDTLAGAEQVQTPALPMTADPKSEFLASVENSVTRSLARSRSEAWLNSGCASASENSTQSFELSAQVKSDSMHWGPAIAQTLFFTGIQQAFRLPQHGTRKGLGGPFFSDWFKSASPLWKDPHWDDGDHFFTNYVSHSAGGSTYGHIWRQNDAKMRVREVASPKDYMKIMGLSFLSGLQFEIGPLSEASIGNVGMNPKAQGYVDIVVTPVLGTAWMLGEDALDKFLVKKFEEKVHNTVARAIVRIGLNPTRSMANLSRFQKPWYRASASQHGIDFRDQVCLATIASPAIQNVWDKGARGTQIPASLHLINTATVSTDQPRVRVGWRAVALKSQISTIFRTSSPSEDPS